MSKQFAKGNVYVFTKKKYMEASCKAHSKSFVNYDKGIWVNMTNGSEVTIDGRYMGSARGMLLVPEWCKCIKNNNSKIEMRENNERNKNNL